MAPCSSFRVSGLGHRDRTTPSRAEEHASRRRHPCSLLLQTCSSGVVGPSYWGYGRTTGWPTYRLCVAFLVVITVACALYRSRCVCVQNVCARLYALVKVTEGSFAATQRCLHCHEDRMSFDAGLQLLDEGMQQLRVISNMLAMARRAASRLQSMSSGRRLSGTTAMTEEDATIMVLAAS